MAGWIAWMGTACAPGPWTPAGPVEAEFLQPGPHGVVTLDDVACCDRDNSPVHAWLPDTAGPAPVLVWGNGTGAKTSKYTTLLEHLASENPGVGDGVPLLEALDLALAASEDATSPLAGRLDPDRVGALGHSQGAGGATNAMIDGEGRVAVLVTFEKPAVMWCSDDAPCPPTSGLTGRAVMYLNGSRDTVISPRRSHQTFYDDTPDSMSKAWGTLAGVNHNDVQGDPGCDGIGACRRGVEGFLGYPTAWLAAHLQDDATARAAFEDGGEFATADGDWRETVVSLR